ncbi:MAG: adenylate/guanylate cyclase domain-containing protein [Betaproteobacteria bacterium]|nr:adenylate/guanylate cyclase domain-containing protein [Betaproteobacteria bacterium]
MTAAQRLRILAAMQMKFPASQAPPLAQTTRRLSAVLFADVVDSVEKIRLDPDGTVARWRTFIAEITHHELPSYQGRIVKLLGDGMLIEFNSAAGAVDCALALQARIEQSNAGIEAGKQLHLRIGVHLADVLADELDLYGDGVNLAARLMALAGARETIISASVRDQVTDGLGLSLEDLGERWLKGMDRPVRAFRVWPPGPTLAQSPDRRRQSGGRPSIAVLPFRNLSSNPAHNFLGDLLAEDMIGALSRQTDLFVISRLSTAPFRDRLYEPRNVADVLGVRYVISGTLQASDTRLRLIGELTEADSGRVIWSERFEGSLADIFDLQDQLSHDIVERVVPFVRQRELERALQAPREPHRLRAHAARDRAHQPEFARIPRTRAAHAGGRRRIGSALRGAARMAGVVSRAQGGPGVVIRSRPGHAAGQPARRGRARARRHGFVGAFGQRAGACLSQQGPGHGDRPLRPGTDAESQRRAGLGLEHDRLCVAGEGR